MLKLSPKDNKEIVELMNTGEYTLQQIGDRYRVTRERIRQIYKEATGKGVNSFRKQRTLAKREIWLNEIAFICKGCTFPIKRKDRKRGQRNFCSKCRHIQVVEQRDPRVLHSCVWCPGKFHPYRNIKYTYFKNRNLFCNQKCYWDWYRCNMAGG